MEPADEGDEVEDRELGGVLDGGGVGRHVAALQKDGADVVVLPDQLQGEVHDLLLGDGVVEVAPHIDDGGELLGGEGVLDDEVGTVLDAAAAEEGLRHGALVGGEDADLLARLQKPLDEGDLDQAGHGHGDVQGLADLLLVVAEEAAGAADGPAAVILHQGAGGGNHLVHGAGVIEAAPVLHDGGELLAVAEVRHHQVVAPVHAAVLEEAVVQGDGVGGEDADLLALLQQGADPGDLHHGGDGHGDVHLVGQLLLEVGEEAAGGGDGPAAFLLQLLGGLQDLLKGLGGAAVEGGGVQALHGLHADGEIVGPGVHHVAGDHGVPDIVQVQDADTVARDVLTLGHVDPELLLVGGGDVAVHSLSHFDHIPFQLFSLFLLGRRASGRSQTRHCIVEVCMVECPKASSRLLHFYCKSTSLPCKI